jgi:hypothetical protein
MNKVVNLFTLGLLFLFTFLAVGTYEDLSLSVYEVNQIKFINEICYGIIFTITLLGILRIKRRWVAIKDIKAFKKFIYISPLSKKAKLMALMFYLLEIIFLSFFIGVFVKELHLDVDGLITPMLIIVSLLVLEILIAAIYTLTSKNVMIIGVNKNLVAFFDREIHVIYFDGLQRISIYQNMFHFKYKLDLNRFIEVDYIPKENLMAFKNALENVLKDKNVFIDETFRQLK